MSKVWLEVDNVYSLSFHAPLQTVHHTVNPKYRSVGIVGYHIDPVLFEAAEGATADANDQETHIAQTGQHS